MTVYSKGGAISYFAFKAYEIKQAYEVYQQVKQTPLASDAIFTLATKIAEAVGVGIPVWFADKIFTATGLDRVFDGLKNDKSFEEFLKDQKTDSRLREIGIGMSSEFLLDYIRKRISDNGMLDPLFDLMLRQYQNSGSSPWPSNDPIEDIKKKAGTASAYASPIVLDLYGGGIETGSLASGTFFDHAADGFAERSGWVGADDGLLVRDLNANGSIDSGRELFGSETLLANGLKASNGFEALKELDTNSDGVINAGDAAFAQLQVWMDANSNGLTDAGELLTPVEAEVQSINVSYSNSTFIDPQGNAHKQLGSYTRTDGQTHAASDVWFASNATYSVPTNWVDVPDHILALPDAQGYGRVRDLHQAMAMDVSGKLTALVSDFTQSESVEDRKVLLRQIIFRWTGVQDIDPTSRTNAGWGNAIGDARKLEALEEFFGEEWRQYSWGSNPGRDAAHALNQAYGQLEALVYGQLMAQSHLESLYSQIKYQWDEEANFVTGDLSAVTNHFLENLQTDRNAALTELGDFLQSLKSMGLLTRMEVEKLAAALGSLGTDVVYVLDFSLAGWTPVAQPTHGNDVLIGRTADDRMNGYGGNDQLWGRAGNDTLAGGAGNDLLAGGAGNDYLSGDTGSDTYRFGRGDGHDVISEYSWVQSENDRIELKVDLTPQDVQLERKRSINGLQVSDDLKITISDTGETITVKNHFNESKSYSVEEVVFSNGTRWGLDAIKSRTLLGGSGEDDLNGFAGRDDVIVGGAGNDRLRGQSGNDLLEGGAGADWLEGGKGSDTYRFALGDDQDVIDESFDDGEDVVELGAGITPADIKVRWTLQGDMAISLPDGGNLTVRGQANLSSATTGIEQVRFADGAVWHRADLVTLALEATDGEDRIIGSLVGDVLEGGAGNDDIEGMNGYDTYRFGVGDGQDTITDNDGRIQFKAGIDQNGVSFALDANDLIATIAASGDAIRIKDWLNSSKIINRFDFFNGAQLTASDVLARLNERTGVEVLYGSPGDDLLAGTGIDIKLYGRAGNDTLIGGAGHDSLFGEGGDDVLDGGPDRDQLYGGAGNNIYRVAPGMGLDEARGESLAVARDTVVFAPGIRPEDLSVQASYALGWNVGWATAGDIGYRKMVIGIGGDDALILNGRNGGDLGQDSIQYFRFDDGTQWTLADLVKRIDGGTIGSQQYQKYQGLTQLGSQADDNIENPTGLSVTVLARGNDDRVYLRAGNNIVSAGSGNDDVWTGVGDDLIAGEAGDDVLYLRDGNNTIVFNYGDGHDELVTGTGFDTISFGAAITPEMLAALVDRDGQIMLLVDGGVGGSITLGGTKADNLPGDLEQVQLIDAEGKTRLFDLAAWLGSNRAALLSATAEAPVHFSGMAFEKTGTLAPVGGQLAVAYAQTGNLFGTPNLVYNTPTDGNDVLYVTAGEEILNAGGGNDIVLGSGGSEAILGGAGNDLVLGGDGDDFLQGGEGNDVLHGGRGADTLLGGAGRDELYGEWGGDNYLYQIGHGEVMIEDEHQLLTWNSGGGLSLGGFDGIFNFGDDASSTESWYKNNILDDAPNILTFGKGIRPEDLRYSERNGDLVIEFANQASDRLILKNYDASRVTRTRSVDVIRFADGTEIAPESFDMIGKTEIADDSGQWLSGTVNGDLLIGGEGDDSLNGNGGSDRLVGGVGSDSYSITMTSGARSPAETLIVETWREQDINRLNLNGAFNTNDFQLDFDGRDLLLRLNSAGDVIRFVGFDPRAPGMRLLVDEIRVASSGVTLSFDILLARGVQYGGQVQDSYEVNIGDGDILINDVAVPDAGNVLRFGTGIVPEALRDNLRIQANGSGGHELIISFGDAGDVVRLSGFDPEDVLGTRAVDGFEFSDGTVWDYATLISQGFMVIGNDSPNDLGGTQFSDRIFGQEGNDVLDGKGGVDTFYGGRGNDILIGGDQVDAYFFQVGDGIDTLIDGPSDNFISFGPGVTQSNIMLSWDDETLVLGYGSGDEIRIPNFIEKISNATPPVTAIKFDDGTLASIPNLLSSSAVAQFDASEIVAAIEDAEYRYTIPLTQFDQSGPFGATRLLNLRQVDGGELPEWLMFDAERGALIGRPTNQDVGQLDLMVEAWGDYGLLSKQHLRLLINNANDAPEVGIALTNQTTLAGTLVNWKLPQGAFSDIDSGDVLNYSASLENGGALPNWLIFDAAAGSFSAKPTTTGSYTLRVSATDLAGESASQTFTLDVVSQSKQKGLPKKIKGNEGVGNGPDGPPPGHRFNYNDGPGTAPGQPGNKHGGGKDDWRTDFLENYKNGSKSTYSALPVLDLALIDQWGKHEQHADPLKQKTSGHDFERQHFLLIDAMNRFDAERAYSSPGAAVGGYGDFFQPPGWIVGNNLGMHRSIDLLSTTFSDAPFNVFSGLHEGMSKLTG
jgi:Ca2+-binding RTX toxin-like protein